MVFLYEFAQSLSRAVYCSQMLEALATALVLATQSLRVQSGEDVVAFLPELS